MPNMNALPLIRQTDGQMCFNVPRFREARGTTIEQADAGQNDLYKTLCYAQVILIYIHVKSKTL